MSTSTRSSFATSIPGWDPQIRPAAPTRDWMDASPEAFAYRCLPLNIANAHGWEVPCPCDFSAIWNGQPETSGVSIRPRGNVAAERLPVSIFGQGVLTFHIQGLFQTPPGWNLWVGGSPNYLKDGIQPLTGVVETDWSPYHLHGQLAVHPPQPSYQLQGWASRSAFSFRSSAVCWRGSTPRYAPLEANAELANQFCSWTRSRDAFQEEMRRNPAVPPSAASGRSATIVASTWRTGRRTGMRRGSG